MTRFNVYLRNLMPIRSALVVLLAFGGPRVEGQLEINVYTAADDGYHAGTTWITPLSTMLLGSAGTPGLFWGVVPGKTIESACQLIEAGNQTIFAAVTAYGTTHDWNMQVIAIGGCDSSDSSPAGVEIVFADDDDRRSAIICDKDTTFTIGCAVYNTGDDIDNVYNKYSAYVSMDASVITTISIDNTGIRKYMHELDASDAACAALGAAVGGMGGLIGGAVLCAVAGVTGVLSFLCTLAGIVIVGGAGAASTCVVMNANGPGCFQGHALVFTSSGAHKPMQELQI